MNKVSILIVNYNGAEYIENTIISMCDLLIDSGIHFETLILDNNSSDDSIKKIHALDAKKYKITLFESKKNLGFGQGNNYLAKKAQYNILMLLNNDTKTLSIDNLSKFLKNKTINNEIITSRIYNKDMSLQNNLFTYPSKLKLTLDLFLLKPVAKRFIKLLEKNPKNDENFDYVTFSGCFFLVSKKIYNEVDGFDEDYTFYHEEGDLFYRIEKKLKIKKLVMNDKIIHYGGGGREISDFAFINYYIGLYKLFNKNNLASDFYLNLVFYLAFNIRIFLLKANFDINYSPFSTLYKTHNTRKRSEVIKLHREVLNGIKLWKKGKNVYK